MQIKALTLAKAFTFWLLIILTGCSGNIYLSNYGYVVGIYSDYVEVRIPCSNVKRPDCGAFLKVDKKEIGDVSFGQKLILK